MTVEYLVLGVVVILVGIGQIYFRHFAGGDDAGAAERRQVPTRRGTAGAPDYTASASSQMIRPARG